MAQDRRRSFKWLLFQWRTWMLLFFMTAAFWAPGPAWAAVLAAGAWALFLVRTDHEMVRTVLSLLATICPPVSWALSYERRQRELDDIFRGVNRTLQHFNLGPLPPREWEELSSRPPYDVEEDLLAACCASVAGRIGRDPEIVELLHRDLQDDATAELWGRISSEEEKKRELAGILVRSSRLPRIDLQPEDRTELVVRALGCLPGPFKLKRVQDELRSWSRLWNHLAAYARYLNGQAPPAHSLKALMEAVDLAIEKGPLGCDYDRAAVEALLETSREWLRGWAQAPAARPEDADDLALVHLGIFSAEHEAAGKPLLAALGCRVAADPKAHGMLLAHLWIRSQPDTAGIQGLKEMALHWEEWLAAATADMGPGITAEVSQVLASHLRKGAWPSQLPVQRAVAEISLQVRKSRDDIRSLCKVQEKTAEWLEKMNEIYQWASGHGLPPSADSLEEIKKAVNDAVKEKVRRLAPAGAPGGFEKRLDDFARRFPPETRPARPAADAPPIVAISSLRERAAGLGRELEQISDMLLAEAGGDRGYLITFDQSPVGLAQVLDKELANDYGFRHYTRYSRIGEMPQGETFADFQERFVNDLNRVLASRNAGDWQQVEITLQSIKNGQELAVAKVFPAPVPAPGPALQSAA